MCIFPDRLEASARYTKYNSRKNISMDEDLQIESDSSLCRKRNSHEIDRRNTSERRRKSIEDNINSSSGSSSAGNHVNHIVSILKRKDSSNSSNTSLVTFSPSVVDSIRYGFSFYYLDTLSWILSFRTTTIRQGILKKRSSLDESRYFRSHSPSSSSADEKSCLVSNKVKALMALKRTHFFCLNILKVNRRRNSFGEINHHGILKQKSYDSNTGDSSGIGGSSGGYNTPNSGTGTVHHGILKKPSSSTPSENQYYSDSQSSHTKHVSISEAVILAAAELCKDMLIIDDGCEPISIRPSILKMDTEQQQQQQHVVNRPKPILKKNHSTENEEIRSILKTSRKSSREESFS